MTEFHLRRIGIPPSHPEVGNCLRLKNHNNARTTFGRDTSQSHYIDSTQYERLISRRQAEITCLETQNGALQFVLKDMSLNGTYVNDVRVNGQCVLNSGDCVTFGHIQGVKISPGQYAPQKNSEVKFVFEEVTEDNQSLEPEILAQTSQTVQTQIIIIWMGDV
ncbi:unnamed protein product [Owenia fusiformis]|uniref:FHA domain-containing protein n=1 Tax=Owenia fusiformis TaxID=6347 RepID=A0A8S4N1I9_OWEFU|nr:unnamed protein product [Owenia fusiformis]